MKLHNFQTEMSVVKFKVSDSLTHNALLYKSYIDIGILTVNGV